MTGLAIHALRLAGTAAVAVLAAVPGAVLELVVLLGLLAAGALAGPVFLLLGRGRAAAADAALMGPRLFARASTSSRRYADAWRHELSGLPRWLAGWFAPAPAATAEVGGDAAATDPARRRILVLSARLPRLGKDGSWGQFVRLLELADRHHVTLFAFLDAAAEEPLAEPLRARGIRVITHLRRGQRGLGNAHHRVPYRLAADYAAAPLRAAVRGLIRGSAYDVLQVEYAEMAHLVHRDVVGLPTVYVVHEPLSLFHLREYERSRGARRLWRWFEWVQNLDYELDVVARFAHVVTVSEVDEAHLRGYLPQLRATSIPNAVDAERVHPLAEVQERQQVTFVGFYGHAPNVDAALWLGREIFPLVRRALPHARLRLVGGGAPPVVQAMAELPGVDFSGYVEELLPCIAESAVMAVPIRLGGGLRGKVLEAWGAAKALVTTTRGGEGFPIEHGRNALVGDDTESFADHLVACLRDAALRRRLGNAGYELVRAQYTPAAIAQRYERVYQEVLGAGT